MNDGTSYYEQNNNLIQLVLLSESSKTEGYLH